MNVRGSLLVLMTVVGQYSDCGEVTQYASVTAIVQEVRVLAEEKVTPSGAGGDAIGGAIIGSFVGMPTLGAIAGAAGADGTSVVVMKITGCKLIVRPEKGKIQFSRPLMLSGSPLEFTAIRNSLPMNEGAVDVCALTRAGDRVTVDIFQSREGNGGEINEFRWKGVIGGYVP
ncbi:hypothetical protein IPJ70_02500 [Candidatus Campbellbacteria bacterium]|nr:MAG: hypothetical protein IPJ70_02500 [Candidatus Campbellbacteria bacterium]